MLGLFAETPVHPGAGRSLGVVDLPVAREEATGFPVIVGSSLKGSLREKAEAWKERKDDEAVLKAFGVQEHAGDVLVSDARLLLLPVRSLDRASRFVTCPQLIERFHRDVIRGDAGPVPAVPKVERGKVLAAGEGHLFLEERVFSVKGGEEEKLTSILDAILPLVRHDVVRERLRETLVVMHDDDFAWYARYGLPVQARNKLDDDGTKRSVNLWYEETLPPDTLMYALLLGRRDDSLGIVRDMFQDDCYLQLGGNASVGQGWFAVTVREGGAR